MIIFETNARHSLITRNAVGTEVYKATKKMSRSLCIRKL